jgi:acetyl-CoA C-acetyltransferase
LNTNQEKKQVVIAGIGMLPVGEHWDLSLRTLGARAVRKALADSGNLKPDAIYIGNGLANILSHQANLGALISDEAGFSGIESCTFEAAGASGAAAFRAACLAVQSGLIDVAVALGVEKITDCDGSTALTAQDLILNYEFEGITGLTVAAGAAIIAQRYISEHLLDHSIFQNIALQSYQHAQDNPNAMYRNGLTAAMYQKQSIKNDPLGLFDISSLADGAAALVVTREELIPVESREEMVRVLGSANAIAPLSLHDRHQLLQYSAASQSAASALRKAGMSLNEVDLFELWDANSIDTVLSMEAIGLALPGKGWQTENIILNSMGGCLGRGNPLGASGAYQLAEAVLQLRGQAGACQIAQLPKRALVQALGGLGSTAITHILGHG